MKKKYLLEKILKILKLYHLAPNFIHRYKIRNEYIIIAFNVKFLQPFCYFYLFSNVYFLDKEN